MVNEKFLQIEDVNVNLDTELHSWARLKEELKMEPVRNIRDTKELTEEIVLLEAALRLSKMIAVGRGKPSKGIADLGDSVKEIDDDAHQIINSYTYEYRSYQTKIQFDGNRNIHSQWKRKLV